MSFLLAYEKVHYLWCSSAIEKPLFALQKEKKFFILTYKKYIIEFAIPNSK